MGGLKDAVLLGGLGSKLPAGRMDQSLNGGQPHQSPQPGKSTTGMIEPTDQGASGMRRRRHLDVIAVNGREIEMSMGIVADTSAGARRLGRSQHM